MKFLSVVMALGVGLLACSSDDSSGGGGATPATGGGSCAAPASYTYVVPAQKEGDYAFNVYQATGSGNLFLSTLSGVYAFDVGSKALTKLYEGGTQPHHVVRDSDVVIIDGFKVSTVAKTGGTPAAQKPFVRLPLETVAGIAELAVEGNLLYAIDDKTGEYFTHDIVSGTETTLGGDVRANRGKIFLGTDALYGYYGNDPDNDNGPTTIFKVPKTGGAPVPLAITGLPGDIAFPIALSGSDLLVFSQDKQLNGHVLRVPQAGGAAVDVGSILYPLVLRGQVFAFPADGGTVIQLQDKIFWLADGSAKMTQIFCFPENTSIGNHGAAAVGKTLYMSVIDSDAKTGGVITAPLP